MGGAASDVGIETYDWSGPEAAFNEWQPTRV